MRQNKVLGSVIGKREIEEILNQNSHYTPEELGNILGIGKELVYQLLRDYGWIKPRKRSSMTYKTVTEEEIKFHLEKNPHLTIKQLAAKLGTSVSYIQKVKREGNFEPAHKGRKLPMTEKELKDRLEYLVKHTAMQRQEMAWELGVTPPTVGNYIKILKKENRIPQDFSFRRKKKKED